MNGKDKVIKIAIYSGQMPGTTFIESLIKGLSEKDNIRILLFGNKLKDTCYPANVKQYPTPSGRLRTFIYLFSGFIRLVATNPKHAWMLLWRVRTCDGSKLRYMAKQLPVLLHLPDIFHIQWAKSLKDWIWLKNIDVKIVLSLRGAHINYSPVVDGELAALYQSHFPLVDAFHAVSDDIGSEAKKYGACNPKTIYSGLEVEGIRFKQFVRQSNEIFHIISIGRWHWVKGYDYAIDAMHALRQQGFRFIYTIIAGKPSEENIYHIRSLGLDAQIVVEREMPHEQVMKHIAASDLLLLPSVSEGLANVALEAMALGTPVLSTRCGGMSELIEDGKTGFLVPMRDSRAIADRIKVIAGLPVSELQEICRNAREQVERRHKLKNAIAEFIELYKGVLA